MKIIVTLITTVAATLLQSEMHAQTLREQLQAREDASSTKIPKEIKSDFAEGIAAVKAAKVVEGAKQAGDEAPDFTLKNAVNENISLATELKKGPVVLTWYRGGWCPYCNIALAALEKELPAIKESGASLMALTPELPDKALSTKEKNNLSFKVLTDLNHEVAKSYGLLFKLTPEVEKHYGNFFNLETFNGKAAGTDTLPLAATYIIGQDGTILWAFLHHDYRMRAEPKDIVNFLAALKNKEN